MGSDLTAIATELYALSPDAFTAARNARAKAAAMEGSRELAERIRRLPKPPVPVWALNALARAEPGMIGGLGALRERFAEAQQNGDRDELRALDAERHEAIAAALSRAESIAANAGKRLGPQAVQDVEQTLRAAVADESAAAAVSSGILVRPMAASGFEPVDITQCVAVPLTDLPAPPPSAAADAADAEDEHAAPAAKKKKGGASTAARERARRAAEAAVAAAEERLHESDARLKSADARVHDIQAATRRLADEQTRLRERLAEVAEQLAELERERTAAERDRVRAERSAERDALGVERARRRQESARTVE